MPKIDLSHQQDIPTGEKPLASRRLLGIGISGFLCAFAFVLINRYLLGDVIVDVRLTSQGPEMLFRGDVGLWAPMSWSQYYWHTARPMIIVPFVLAIGAIAYWHNWETTEGNGSDTGEY